MNIVSPIEKKTTLLSHVTHYGEIAADDEEYHGPLPDEFTFNSPIGICMDRHGHVWICDTGNNRIVILNNELNTILRIIRTANPNDRIQFKMPFHICQHPTRDSMYITDLGNSRVVVIDFTKDRFHFSFSFGQNSKTAFEPLQDPNGITIVEQPDGHHHVFVADEFFHTKTDKTQRNRCVIFNDDGQYIDEFRTLISPDGKRHDLLWPQGLSSDRNGNVYIANTGKYEILKYHANGRSDNEYCQQSLAPLITHCFQQPSGVGMLNIMRSVSAINNLVFVPDHTINTISVYDIEGNFLSSIVDITPVGKTTQAPPTSPSDSIYYALENETLLNPYSLCQGEAEDIFLVTEPFTSRILKLQISTFEQASIVARLTNAIGSRRNRNLGNEIDPQFNCVTSVLGIAGKSHFFRDRTNHKSDVQLPESIKFNPFQRLYMHLSESASSHYHYWYEYWHKFSLTPPAKQSGSLRLNIDSGNWTIKAYLELEDQFESAPHALIGYYIPGDLAMAKYHPKRPLLGQLCPGTPLVLVSNFNYGTVTIYQLNPNGKLINYGIPFGILGSSDGCLLGPQGLAVNDDGEIYIVDSLNHRISKWQILQTGQVFFIKNFSWDSSLDERDPDHANFTPTDIAVDSSKRLFTTDQFNNRICVFDHHGKSLWSYGKKGYWEEGEADPMNFMLPTSLAVDGNNLIVNDLVNRALKVFEIHGSTLEFITGVSLFKLPIDKGGLWMPFFLYAENRRIYVPDSTYNVVQVFDY